MLLGIDHLVIAVHSVEAAETEMTDTLGLAFTGGGRHEAWGTYNRLAFLGDTYLELIGVVDRSLAAGAGSVGRATLARLEAGGEGLVMFALAVDDLARDVADLRHEGSPIGAAEPGSRRRSDGEVVRWWTADAGGEPAGVPFLIEHELGGAEWGAAARAGRAAFAHPGGGRVRLASLELPVADAPAVAEAYGRVLGIAFSEGWRAAIGGQSLELVAGAAEPVVHLVGDAGTELLDELSQGIRWSRRPGDGR